MIPISLVQIGFDKNGYDVKVITRITIQKRNFRQIEKIAGK